MPLKKRGKSHIFPNLNDSKCGMVINTTKPSPQNGIQNTFLNFISVSCLSAFNDDQFNSMSFLVML